MVVVKSTSANPDPDPVVFLIGGPGLPTVTDHALEIAAVLDYNRDLIMMDQRGTGISKPLLLCEDGEEGDDGDDGDDDDILGGKDDDDGSDDKGKDDDDVTFLRCHKKLKDKGINLSNYNTKENAADFADLAEAMDLNKVNYYGISYGTRVALELLRSHPDHVRSVILDGALPTHIYPMSQTSQGFWEALLRMAKDCTSNSQCNQKYADTSKGLDFSATFQALLSKVDGSPIQNKGKAWNKKDIVTLLSQFISSGEVVRLPYIVKKLYDGDLSVLNGPTQRHFSSGGGPSISFGMAISVVCHDEVPFDSESRVQRETNKYHVKDSEFQSRKSLCDKHWKLGKKGSSDIKQPVKSDIPALIFSGAYDVQTPDFWAKSMKKHLSKSYYFLFPAGGHGNLVPAKKSQDPNHQCGHKLGKAFLTDPDTEPQDDCIRKLSKPNFLIL